MTIAELIKELSVLPQDMTVILAGDPEGNVYREMDEVDVEDGVTVLYPSDVLHDFDD